MKLHHSDAQPDWATIKKSDRNIWQRIAATTDGILTQGNIITIVGFALVLAGLLEITWHQYWLGIWGIIVGRLCDVADGWFAELTKTKSPLGELLDAGLDKIGTLFIIVVLYWADIAPLWILLTIFIPHLIIACISLYFAHKKRRLHPSLEGKISMATASLSLLGFVIIQALAIHSPNVFSSIPYIIALISSALGFYTAIRYIMDRE